MSMLAFQMHRQDNYLCTEQKPNRCTMDVSKPSNSYRRKIQVLTSDNILSSAWGRLSETEQASTYVKLITYTFSVISLTFHILIIVMDNLLGKEKMYG